MLISALLGNTAPLSHAYLPACSGLRQRVESELLLVYTLFNDRVMVGYPSVDLAFESFLLEHLTDT
jgi:hypothetical protein